MVVSISNSNSKQCSGALFCAKKRMNLRTTLFSFFIMLLKLNSGD